MGEEINYWIFLVPLACYCNALFLIFIWKKGKKEHSMMNGIKKSVNKPELYHGV